MEKKVSVPSMAKKPYKIATNAATKTQEMSNLRKKKRHKERQKLQ